MFTPTTGLRLLSVPIESDYKNTLWFPDRTTQTNYFLGKTVKTFESFQYIKKDNTIVVNGEVDLMYNCNYVMYQNNNFSNKWFYAFINRIEWASNSSVRLYVSTDVIQTWFFDITYYQSYVDRCHSDTDAAGDNIVPEDFSGSVGICYHQAGTQDMTPNSIMLFCTSTATGSSLPGAMVSQIYSGTGAVFKENFSASDITNYLDAYVKNGTANAIVKMQQYPSNHDRTVSFAKHPNHLDTVSGNANVSYTPTNKKLLSGAFIQCYIQLYGEELTFNPECISGSNITIQIGADRTSGTVGAIVTNYGNSNNTALTLTAIIPQSTWAYNQYKNDYNLHAGSNSIYMRRANIERATMRNTAALKTTIAGVEAASTTANQFSTSNLVKTLVNGPAGAIGNALGSAAQIAQSGLNTYEAYQQQRIWQHGFDDITQDLVSINENYNAPAVGGGASSNIYLATNKTALSYGYKVPPLDILKRMDKYLTVYGYKQSEYRNINLHARASWTFIKTNGLNATGNFPDDDMNIIKRVFDNGVFFWVYNKTFGNFDQSNGIV